MQLRTAASALIAVSLGALLTLTSGFPVARPSSVSELATVPASPPPSPRSALGPSPDAGPTASASPDAVPAPSAPPDATPAPAKPTPRPPQATDRPSGPTPGADGRSVRVDSIPDLLAALDQNSITDIEVADGTYRIRPAADQAVNSLWIGARFADRTRSVRVHAETRGGVTFDGGGTSPFGCISFVEGAHHQTWDGFTCAHGEATNTGVVVLGGYPGRAAPHHITIRHLTITATCTGRTTAGSTSGLDHAIYVSEALDGPHHLLFTDVNIDGRGGLTSGFQFFHSDGPNRNAWNVTVRRLRITGTEQAIILWDPTLRDITFDTATIVDAGSVAVRYEAAGASDITFANIRSTGSGSGRGFFSSLGDNPEGVTLSKNSFH